MRAAPAQGPSAGITRTSARCQACGEGGLQPECKAADGELFRCAGCGTWRLIPYPGRDGDGGEGYGEAYRRGLDDDKPGRCLQILRERVPQRAGARLLDVGCADGAFLGLARRHGWEVRGLDPDPNAVEAARLRGIEVSRGLAGDAKPVEGLFDAVTLWDVVEHLDNPEDVAAGLAGTVQPGGYVVVLTPDAASVFDRLAQWERALTRGRGQRITTLCLNQYHLHRFSAPGLRRLFERHGFRVEVLARTHLFSLRPERYLNGFAPGIQGWTPFAGLNRALSRALFLLVRALGIRNKLLLVARREPADGPRPLPA